MKKFLAALFVFLSCTQLAYASIIPSIPYNLTNGSIADATQVMGNFNTILSDVNANAATAGANTNITSIGGLTTPLSTAQGGTPVYVGGTTGGSGNAQTLAATNPSSFTLTKGSIVTGVAGATNTGAVTLDVGGTGVIAVDSNSPSGLAALTGGEIVIGQPYMFYYDGTIYELINPSILAINPITNSQLATMAADTLKGNNTNTSATPTDIAVNAGSLVGRAATGDIANIGVGYGVEFNSTNLRLTGGGSNCVQSTPGNPTGTNSTTGVMMGLATSITPVSSGTIEIIITQDFSQTNTSDGAKYQIRYGTGTAPSNAASLTGTAVGSLKSTISPNNASSYAASGLNAVITGLTPGTPYWIDESLGAVIGGTASVTDISISSCEIR